MKILIIGGTGYIGSQLYVDLIKDYEVDTLDLEWFGNCVNPKNIKHNYNSINKTKLDEYDVVILLAAHSSVPMCLNNMTPAFQNNVVNFVYLLNKLSHQKFIYASSSSVYGDTGSMPAKEDWDRFRPKNYYDLTKQEIDFYAELSNIEYYGLRFGTVNGPSPNLRVDIMINKMYHEAKQIGFINMFNSQISRPILGIYDLCRAMRYIIKSGDHRGVYNLASFNGVVKDIVNNVGKYIEVDVNDMGNTPSYNFSIDTSKFENVYKFEFKDTIETIIDALNQEYDQIIQKDVRANQQVDLHPLH
jgi:nucleoside-diphosphate-sugar epimerase